MRNPLCVSLVIPVVACSTFSLMGWNAAVALLLKSITQLVLCAMIIIILN
jgi:hypothetical protein